jgi:hypothetical protein
MRMLVCYLDFYEAGLWCYLVIHIENLLVHTAVLLPFVTYLLTLPRTNMGPQTSSLRVTVRQI